MKKAAPKRINVMTAEGYAILKKFEGLKTKAYQCPAGVWTIGYGHTGKDVYQGQEITPALAERLLEVDAEKACNSVRDLISAPLTDSQFSALVCLVYNIGEGAFRKSRMRKALNYQNYAAAPRHFMKWVFAGGKRLAGLEKRRAAEANLFSPGSVRQIESGEWEVVSNASAV